MFLLFVNLIWLMKSLMVAEGRLSHTHGRASATVAGTSKYVRSADEEFVTQGVLDSNPADRKLSKCCKSALGGRHDGSVVCS